MFWLMRLKQWLAHQGVPCAGLPRRERREMARAATTRRDVLQLAWPITAAMLGDTAMGLVDTKLVGALGAPALAGVGLGTMLMWLGYSTMFGFMRGVKVRSAHAIGEQQPENGVRYLQVGAFVGVLAGVLVWCATRDVTWVLRGLRVDPSTVAYGSEFLAARTFGAPAIFFVSATVQYRQSVGDSRTAMLVGLMGNVINAVLAYGLIYGHWGLPALGVRGAGYGTAVAEGCEALACAGVLLREMRGAKPIVSFRRALAEVANLGVPVGVHRAFETLAFTAFTAILGSLGAREVAAHQIAMAVIRTSFLPGFALSEAAAVLVGQALGARKLREADRVASTALTLAVGFMTVCGVAFALWGHAIAGAFTDEPPVVSVVQRLLLVAAVFQTLDAVNIVLRGALNGAKDVRMVAAIGTTIVWVCVPGAAFLLGREAGMGALGGWIGFVGETTLSAAVFYWRWRRGTWRTKYEGLAVGGGEREVGSPVAVAVG